MTTAAVRDEVRRAFPVWFNVWLSLGHVLTAFVFIQPPQAAAVATLAFPLVWVVLYYWLGRRGTRPDRATLAWLSLSAPAVAFLWWLPARLIWRPDDPSALRLGDEVLAILWVVLLVLHCRRERGWAAVSVFFGVGAIYGFFLENSGISLGYFTESGYNVYVPFSNTPLSSVAGWCTVFYPSVFISEALVGRLPAARRRILWPAAIVTTIAVSSDIHFDHIATALGMWTWNPQLPAFFLGVPLVNYTSWVCAVFAFASVYYFIERRSSGATVTPRLVLLALPVMLAISALANLLLIGLLEGFSGPSWRIVRDALATTIKAYGT